MFICEYTFNISDKTNPKYSQREINYYSWIFPKFEVSNHRLSLRKNLETGEFEIYRKFNDSKVKITRDMVIVSLDDVNIETIAFNGNFEEALEFGNDEYERFWEEVRDDKPCEHEYPNEDIYCGRKR